MAATNLALQQSQPGSSVLTAFPETGTSQGLDLLQIVDLGGAALARVNSAGAVIGGSTSGFVLTAAAVGTLALTAVAVASFVLTSVVGATGVYTGTITGGAADAYVGKQVKIAGFVASAGANNGTFTITHSSATTITVAVTTQVDETHAGTAQVSGVSLATYTGTITGGGTNNFAGKSVIIAGFAAGSGANNGTFTIVSNTTTSIVVLSTNTTVAETHAGTAQVATVSLTTYTGTITGGGSSALAGLAVTFSGFAASTGANNIAGATIVSSTTTQIVVLTTTQVNETHAGVATLAAGLSATNGTRVGKFLTRLSSSATIAQLFADAFTNPANLDILQVINLGGNPSYYLDYLGVAHGS